MKISLNRAIVFSLTLGLFVLFSSAYILPQPPKIEDKPTYEYLRLLYNRYNHARVVTVSPNGSQLGDYGEFEILLNAGNYYLEVNTSSPNGKVWKGVQLTAVP